MILTRYRKRKLSEIEAMSSAQPSSSTSKASPGTSQSPGSCQADVEKTSLYPYCQTTPYDYEDNGNDERENISTRVIQAIISSDKILRLSRRGDEIQVGKEKFLRQEVWAAYNNMEKLVNLGSAMERLISMNPSLTVNLKHKILEGEDDLEYKQADLDMTGFVKRVVDTIDVNKEVETVTKSINQLMIYLTSVVDTDTFWKKETKVWAGDEVDPKNLEAYFTKMEAILDKIEADPDNLCLKQEFLTEFDYNLFKRGDATRKSISDFNVKASIDLKKCMTDALSNVVTMHKAQYVKAIDDEIHNLELAIKMLQNFTDVYTSKMTDDLKSKTINNINKCLYETQKLLDAKNKFFADEINQKNLDIQQTPDELIKKKKHNRVFQVIANVVDKVSI